MYRERISSDKAGLMLLQTLEIYQDLGYKVEMDNVITPFLTLFLTIQIKLNLRQV